MQRFSISFDDELAAWVESRAEERGVSKAKVIRDAVATARETDTDLVQTGDVIARLEDLEDRVDALEQTRQEAIGDELAEAFVEKRDLDISVEEDDTPGTATDDFLDQMRSYLADHPPRTDSGEAAMLTAFERLRELETAQTAELREYVYEQHGEEYADANSLWQSIQRYFDGVPGVEKSGHGEWTYAGDEAAREQLQE